MAYGNHQISSMVIGYVVVVLFGCSTCLHVTVDVPRVVELNNPATLVCSYDLGTDHLYSVKWYHESKEFFRYLPSIEYRTMSFSNPGLSSKAGVCGPTSCSVQLRRPTAATSGVFTCEVSTEAPVFRDKTDSGRLSVMVLPKEDPVILGLTSGYSVGELLDITCRSAPSDPPADVSLFLNNEQMGHLSITYEMMENNLTRTSARLRQVLQQRHFQGNDGMLRVVCSAVQERLVSTERTADGSASLVEPDLLSNEKLNSPNTTGKSSNSVTISKIIISGLLFARKLFS